MPTVLLNNDDITVLGPPTTIDVSVDIGPQGTRGSKTIVGSGEPNTHTTSGVIFGQSLIYNDLYINTSPGANYGYMYQYVSTPGGDTWVQVLKVSPTLYSAVNTATFTTGNASLTIPISNIVTVSGSPLTATDFNVQYQIEGANPIASSIEIPALVSPNTNLVLNFHGVEYSGSSWSALSGSKKIHVFISIV